MNVKEYYNSTRLVETRNWTLEMAIAFAQECVDASSSVCVIMQNGSLIKGKLISFNGAKQECVELKIDEMCLVEIEKKQKDFYAKEVIEINKKYITNLK